MSSVWAVRQVWPISSGDSGRVLLLVSDWCVVYNVEAPRMQGEEQRFCDARSMGSCEWWLQARETVYLPMFGAEVLSWYDKVGSAAEMMLRLCSWVWLIYAVTGARETVIDSHLRVREAIWPPCCVCVRMSWWNGSNMLLAVRSEGVIVCKCLVGWCWLPMVWRLSPNGIAFLRQRFGSWCTVDVCCFRR